MIRLLQCLCPKRHPILGVAYEGEDPIAKPEDLKAFVLDAILKQTINPWCRICESLEPTWIYEDIATSFRSMDEAQFAQVAIDGTGGMAFVEPVPLNGIQPGDRVVANCEKGRIAKQRPAKYLGLSADRTVAYFQLQAAGDIVLYGMYRVLTGGNLMDDEDRVITVEKDPVRVLYG